MTLTKKATMVGGALLVLGAGGYVGRNVVIQKAETALVQRLQHIYPDAKVTHGAIHAVPWQAAVAVDDVVVVLPESHPKWREFKVSRIESGMPTLSGMPKQITAKGVELAARNGMVARANEVVLKPTEQTSTKTFDVTISDSVLQTAPNTDAVRVKKAEVYGLNHEGGALNVASAQLRDITVLAAKSDDLNLPPMTIDSVDIKKLLVQKDYANTLNHGVTFEQLVANNIKNSSDGQDMSIEQATLQYDAASYKANIALKNMVFDNKEMTFKLSNSGSTSAGNMADVSTTPYTLTAQAQGIVTPKSDAAKKNLASLGKETLDVSTQITVKAEASGANATAVSGHFNIDMPAVAQFNIDHQLTLPNTTPPALHLGGDAVLQGLTVRFTDQGAVKTAVASNAKSHDVAVEAVIPEVADALTSVLRENRLGATADQLRAALLPFLHEGGTLQWQLQGNGQALQSIFINALINPQGTLDGLKSTITHQKAAVAL